MANSWTKLTVSGKLENLDCITAVMSMLDDGLLIEDLSDMKVNEMYGDLIDESVLNADISKISVSLFVPEDSNPAEYITFIRDRLLSEGISDYSIECEGIKQEDWAENWKKYYHPVHIGNITIVPAWEEYEAAPDEITVKMDAGMAFGTGTHETTRLVIRMLPDEIKGNERVLDIGTGSGILSMCASKLGAAEINAYDIDEDAVRVARENIELDGAENITCAVSDLLKNVDKSRGLYDIALANIVSDIILRMMPGLSDYLVPKGRAILSGIILPRLEDVKKSVTENGFIVKKELFENDWCGLLIEKRD